MNKNNVFKIVILIGIAVLAGFGFPNSASATCTLNLSQFVAAYGAGQISSVINQSGSVATAVISNSTGCLAPMSLSAYKMFGNGALSQQVLFSSSNLQNIGSNGTLNVDIPGCMTQIDLWYGQAPITLLDSNPYGADGYEPHVMQWRYVNSNVCTITPVTPVVPDISVSCSATPNTTTTNQPVTFIPVITGGTGSYTFSWTGACTGSGTTCTTTPNSTGTFTTYLAVTSGSHSVSASAAASASASAGSSSSSSSASASTGNNSAVATATTNCSVIVSQAVSNLSASCVASPSSTTTNQPVTFAPTVTGGSGSYTYLWTGACTGTGVTCTTTPTGTGTYTSYLAVTSGSQTATTNCSTAVSNQTNNHSYTQCYNDDVYWYNSAGVRQELLQTCTSDNYNGSNYCVGNSVYRQGYSNGGCANGACYNTGNNNGQLVQTCLYNQTCQNGNCVNTTNNNDHMGCYNNAVYWFDTYNTRQGLIQTCLFNQTCQNGYCVNTTNYNDHRGCYNNSVYWFDSIGNRQTLIQTCLYNQTCQNGYCVTTYIPPTPTPTPANYRACYNNDLYTYNGLTNVRLSLYRSCADSNACTFDSCSGSTCTNLLKCDGTTCAKGSADYVTQCTVCGDGVCDQGETIQSCPQDCNVIGLAVTIFGKRENDPVQWTKSFTANANQNLDFLLVVSNGLDTPMNDVSVKANLPSEILYKGGLKLEGVDYLGDIRTGVTLGSLAPKSTRTLTFKGQIADNNAIFGSEADALATVTTSAGTSQDTAVVFLNKTNTNNNGTTFVPQQGLAGLLGINLSNPLYLFLIIIIIILVLLGIARMIQGFRRD